MESRLSPSAPASQRSGACCVVFAVMPPETISRSRARVMATYTSRCASASSASCSRCVSCSKSGGETSLPPGEGTWNEIRPSAGASSPGTAMFGSRPASASATMSNSSPFAACTVIIRTASHLLLREGRLGSCDARSASVPTKREEAGEVGSAQRLVVAREADQLAHVRVAAASVGLRQAGEVVVVLRDDALEQFRDADAAAPHRRAGRSAGGTPSEAASSLGEAVRLSVLEPAEQRGLGGRRSA